MLRAMAPKILAPALLGLVSLTLSSRGEAIPNDYGSSLRLDASGPMSPREVAACLGKRSGVGLAVANPVRGRRRSFLNLFVRGGRLDPGKPLVNEVRFLTVILTPKAAGTRARLYLRSSYRLRSTDGSILFRCLRQA